MIKLLRRKSETKRYAFKIHFYFSCTAFFCPKRIERASQQLTYGNKGSFARQTSPSKMVFEKKNVGEACCAKYQGKKRSAVAKEQQTPLKALLTAHTVWQQRSTQGMPPLRRRKRKRQQPQIHKNWTQLNGLPSEKGQLAFSLLEKPSDYVAFQFHLRNALVETLA